MFDPIFFTIIILLMMFIIEIIAIDSTKRLDRPPTSKSIEQLEDWEWIKSHDSVLQEVEQAVAANRPDLYPQPTFSSLRRFKSSTARPEFKSTPTAIQEAMLHQLTREDLPSDPASLKAIYESNKAALIAAKLQGTPIESTH